MFKFYLYKFGQFLVTYLPVKFCYQVGVFLADLQYFFSKTDRTAVAGNLRVILKTDGDVKRETREVFHNFSCYLVEFFRMARKADFKFIKQNIKIENKHYLEEVLKYGKGGIVVTGHIGNWELGALVLGMLGYHIEVIALPHSEKKVNDFFNQQRESKGVVVIPSVNAVRKSIEVLRNNGLLAVAADRDFVGNGFEMNFLGRKVIIPKGAAAFSYKTGAPMIPAFMIRNPDNTFTFSFEKPIYTSESNDTTATEQQLIELMRPVVDVIEQYIRRYPTQWLMMRKFWIE